MHKTVLKLNELYPAETVKTHGTTVLNEVPGNPSNLLDVRLIGGPLNNQIVKVSTDIRPGENFEAQRRSMHVHGKTPNHKWLPVGPYLTSIPNPYKRNCNMIDGRIPTKMGSYKILSVYLDDDTILFYGSYNHPPEMKVYKDNHVPGHYPDRFNFSEMSHVERFQHDLGCFFGTANNKHGEGYTEDDGGNVSYYKAIGRRPLRVRVDKYDLYGSCPSGYKVNSVGVLGFKVYFFGPIGVEIRELVAKAFGPKI